MTKIHLTPVGIVREEDGEYTIYKFGKNTEEMAKTLFEVYTGEYKNKKLIKDLVEKDEIIVTSRVLFNILNKDPKLSGKVKLEEKDISTTKLLVKTKTVDNEEEAQILIKEILISYSEEKLKRELANRDQLIIHAINSYDEYTETINLFYERLREWYGIYFPELSDIITKIESYANLISSIGYREEYSEKILKKFGYSDKRARTIEDAANRSLGGMLNKEDIEMMMKHASTLRELIKTRDRIEEYLETLLDEVAPNVKAIVGTKLAARLIAKAGGIKRLAMYPSSTIQLLGAEKALFLALRKGRKPPKHGIIFQHPFINQSPKVVRGKIARLLAGKISIAAKIDAFGGEYIGDKIYKEIEKKVEEIRKTASIVKKKKIKPVKKGRSPRFRRKKR